MRRQAERAYSDKYDSLHVAWQKKMDKFESSVRKRQKDAKYRECFEKIFPELRKRREEKERLAQKQKEAAALLLPSSTAADNAVAASALADIQSELNSIEVTSNHKMTIYIF
jgi:hypothetical protein